MGRKVCGGGMDVIARRAKREATLDTGWIPAVVEFNCDGRRGTGGTACLTGTRAGAKYMYLHTRSADVGANAIM